MEVKQGELYRHRKTGVAYVVLAVGKHTETGEELVTYRATVGQPQCDPHMIWVRPLAMFADGRFAPFDAIEPDPL